MYGVVDVDPFDGHQRGEHELAGGPGSARATKRVRIDTSASQVQYYDI